MDGCEILHQKDGWNLINNGKKHGKTKSQLVQDFAGPSTVWELRSSTSNHRCWVLTPHHCYSQSRRSVASHRGPCALHDRPPAPTSAEMCCAYTIRGKWTNNNRDWDSKQSRKTTRIKVDWRAELKVLTIAVNLKTLPIAANNPLLHQKWVV